MSSEVHYPVVCECTISGRVEGEQCRGISLIALMM